MTLFQLAAAREALSARSSALAQSAFEQDAELDSWYDLLLKESFDDVAESGHVMPKITTLLLAAKALERIGGYSQALSAEVAFVVRS